MNGGLDRRCRKGIPACAIREGFLEEVDIHKDLQTDTVSGYSQEKERRESVPAAGDQKISPSLVICSFSRWIILS